MLRACDRVYFRLIMIILAAPVATTAVGAATGPVLVNPGFEESLPDGTPLGWTVIDGLDPHGYGAPEYTHRFDAVHPVQGNGGYLSAHCLAFPARDPWSCPVFTHSNGDGKGIDGRRIGKAAVFQTVHVPAGRYCFAVWLRTADGARYSAAFSLGLQAGTGGRYAHDDSTGIAWSAHNLAVRVSEIHSTRERGEWSHYSTEPLVLVKDGPITVWIRFNYANENQFLTRWQADDAMLVVIHDQQDTGLAARQECKAMDLGVRHREFCGDMDHYLIEDGGSTVVEAPEARLFRHARQLQPGQALRYRFPSSDSRGPASLLVAGAGPLIVQVDSRSLRAGGGSIDKLTTFEWPINTEDRTGREIEVRVQPAGDSPARVYEVEVGYPGRTRTRLSYVEADVTAVPWLVGTWDASPHEFSGQSVTLADDSELATGPLEPTGRWQIAFEHAPKPGYRYYLVHGLIRGTCSIDVGANGVVDWVATQDGEEIVGVDVTDLLKPGRNTVLIDSTGQHDFAALVETCPGAENPQTWQLAFEGDEFAANMTRVARNTWFWLRELHYEPSGFIDASPPVGHWYNQFWPIDIAFALREWIHWGHHEESLRAARLVAKYGWQGHESNRSGGSDNTGGNILVRELCDVLLRSDLDPSVVSDLWPVVQAHAAEVISSAESSPFGLIRGTNWENAGNRERGPCYALSTTLGAATSLQAAASVADRLNDQESAKQWREQARELRQTVLDRLVLKQDHRCPSGFVLPRGTWAYGLRPDGSIEDQPLAGYLWSGAALPDVQGFVSRDSELLSVYDRTTAVAMPLFARGERGVVSGYADSYDGPEITLVLAALADRIDFFRPLLLAMSKSIDCQKDVGAIYGELSRWAVGGPGTAEDTNLVGAAGFLWPLRVLAGIDDQLIDGQQLTLVPRLPWTWKRMFVNDWPIRCRDENGKERWNELTLRFDRDEKSARLAVRTTSAIKGVRIRLGPFPINQDLFATTIDGRPVEGRLQQSGDAVWVWTACDVSAKGVRVETRVAR